MFCFWNAKDATYQWQWVHTKQTKNYKKKHSPNSNKQNKNKNKNIDKKKENLEDSIEMIKSRPKPLALYVFSNNKTFCEKVIENTDAGSVCVNDCAVQTLFPGFCFEILFIYTFFFLSFVFLTQRKKICFFLFF